MTQIAHIAVVNQSSVVTNAEAQAATVDLATQAKSHVAPFWSIRGTDVKYFDTVPGYPYVPLLIVDSDAQVPGALGYHDEDSIQGPYGRVLAATCKKYNVPWTSCASHELIEILGDLDVDQWCSKGTELISRELCDPVESNLYRVGNTVVSDFVLPSWFDNYGKAPFSFMDLTKKMGAPNLANPFQIAKGGYAIVSTQWPKVTQVFASGEREYPTPEDAYPEWKIWELKLTKGSRSLRRRR